ncbi:MAG: WD40/YVTN/BNR-like repeat-containing protein [Candidatus Binataceae bacterium]
MSAEKRTDPTHVIFPRAPAAGPRRLRPILNLRLAVPVVTGVIAILAVAQAFVEHDRAPIRVARVPRAEETLVIPRYAASFAPSASASAPQTRAVKAPLPRIAAAVASRAITSSAPGLPAGTTRIIAPDRSVSWAIGRDGAIFHSNRAGAVSSQSSEVTTNLTAGAAASEHVCWVVGRAGTILRTTDGGAHWSQVSAPVGDDKRAMSEVSAKSANDAGVIDAAGRRYYTTDGGSTWSRR